jgi:raffinose/stachyose/melibiose transport system substrate-binding protein
MKLKLKSILSTVLAITVVLGMTACGPSDPTSQNVPGQSPQEQGAQSQAGTSGFPEPIELTIATFRVGTHVAATAEARWIREFEELYNGIDRQKITIKLEEMPSDEEYYNQMKIRVTSNTLPDVFEGERGVLELAVSNGIAVDMRSYVDADPQYKEELGPGAIESGSQWADGGLYNIPYALQAIGYYYNKDMFAQAGVSVPNNWDEFMTTLETLKQSGVCRAPLALMTGENSWTTNLILASIIGTSGDSGNRFMNTRFVDKYEVPEFISALEKVQVMLRDYAMPDAIGADYATAANHFLNENTAIIANGPWMSADFTDTDKAAPGFVDKVGVALFPENGAISQFERGYSIARSTPEREAAAMEFIKFKTNAYGQLIHLEDVGAFPLTSNVELSPAFRESNPIVVSYVNLLSDIKYSYMTIDTISYPTAITGFSTLYPELAAGTMTAAEMARELDVLASRDALFGQSPE